MPENVCQKIVAFGINQRIAFFSVCDRMRLPKCFSVIGQKNVREFSQTDRGICICILSPSISWEHPLVMRELIPFASLHLVGMVTAAVLSHWCFSTLTYSSFFINFRWLLLLSLFSASFVAIYGVGRSVCSLETYFVNPGKIPFVYLRKWLRSHYFSHQPTVRFSVHV